MTRTNSLMLCGLVALSLADLPLAAQAPAKLLTVEEIFAQVPLIGHPPEAFSWSPDGKRLSYMEDGELMEMKPNSGDARVLVSRARLAELTGAKDSETDRDHRSRYHMASILWSLDTEHLLFDRDGRLWLYDLRDGASNEIAATGAASGDDPKFSPDGESVSFIRDHGLAVASLKQVNTPTMMVAPAPDAKILSGEVDWVYEEELDVRSNYFWSPDSKWLAYLQMNESKVPAYPITDWNPTHAAVDWQRYPQPGDPNPDVRVGVVSARGGETIWVKLPIRAGDDYIPRFGWADAKTLWIETLSRDQKHRDLYFADAATGRAHPVLQLTDDKFFDDQYDVFVHDGSIVLTQWNDGHNHLYLYSYDQSDPAHAQARLERQLTHDDFEVSEILRVDTANKLIDFASNEGNLLEQQLWRVRFSGERKQLSEGAGFHEGNFAPAGGAYVDRQSARMEPPTIKLCAEAAKCNVVWRANALGAYHMRAPRQIEVKAHNGRALYATLLLPEAAVAPASVPLIVNPYGGPGEQSVANRWSDSLLFDELLAEHGFAVLHADNRGMSGRGRAFAQAAYHDFGAVQFEDQLTVVDAALTEFPQLDARRLGWWGWSWGGTFTLYAMTHSDRIRAGVAVAPVTDWRDYDSIYTERYLGEPAEFAAGYKDYSVTNSAANLKGRLLLAHGTADDNVHLQNSVQFAQKLIHAGIPCDLQIYPDKMHSIAGTEARSYLFNRILEHFEEYLKPIASSPQEH